MDNKAWATCNRNVYALFYIQYRKNMLYSMENREIQLSHQKKENYNGSE